jgi:hypothetical protein
MTYTASLDSKQQGGSLRATAPAYSANLVRIGAGQLCECGDAQTICDYVGTAPINPTDGLALVGVKFTHPTAGAGQFLFNGGSAVIVPASGNAAIVAQIKAQFIAFLNSYLLDADANVEVVATNLVFTANSALQLTFVSTLVAGTPTDVAFVQTCP